MSNNFYLDDIVTDKPENQIERGWITDFAALLGIDYTDELVKKSADFSDEIRSNFIADFKKDGDKMVHVSSFCVIDGIVYMTYYANTSNEEENPNFQVSRMACCPLNDTKNMKYFDLQAAGDTLHGKKVNAVYDTILMQKDNETLYLMWTADLDGNYYRLYRTYSVSTGELGEIFTNKFKVCDEFSDFCITGMKSLLTKYDFNYKYMHTDIGIMQKITSRVENGDTYYYTGAYCGEFNCIIKSKDFVTWEYVAQPDFVNLSLWENACYVLNDKCYYFVRQRDTDFGFLTYYDLIEKTWAKPVLIYDCQSRSDFIMYKEKLFLFHAPIDRNYIGIVRVCPENLAKSKQIIVSDIKESCFYSFIQYGEGQLYLSYTSDRKHIKLTKFDPEKYLK